MKRYIKFSKYTALGNDFIMINDLYANYKKLLTENTIKKLCTQHLGIGADGLILIESDDETSFKMVYYNSDGKEAPMCGNGARASAYFAMNENIAGLKGTFKASDGLHSFVIKDSTVQVSLNVDYKSILLDKTVNDYKVSFINSGVPHAIVFVDDTDQFPVEKIGKLIREDISYSDTGVNVDFVQIIDNHNIKIRTYERGVEGETYSCGTGAVGASIISTLKSFTNPPINVINKLGEILKVDLSVDDISVKEVLLEGKIKELERGSFNLNEC